MGIFDGLFGSYSKRELAKIEPIKNKVLSLEDEYTAMSEETLKSQTNVLKERLEKGETLEDILPEALATVREAAWRVLGKKPFPVQIIGAIVLNQGRIAEMKTGEGKTLVACCASYLCALEGKGVHVVTVNDYLANSSLRKWVRFTVTLVLQSDVSLTSLTMTSAVKHITAISHTVQTTSSASTISVTIWLSI